MYTVFLLTSYRHSTSFRVCGNGEKKNQFKTILETAFGQKAKDKNEKVTVKS